MKGGTSLIAPSTDPSWSLLGRAGKAAAPEVQDPCNFECEPTSSREKLLCASIPHRFSKPRAVEAFIPGYASSSVRGSIPDLVSLALARDSPAGTASPK